MTTPTPQDVLARPARTAIFLVATVNAGGEGATRDLLADLSGLTRSVAFRVPEAELSSVAGIGSDLWDRLFEGAARPLHLHPFSEVRGATHVAPATPGDLLFHLRAERPDVCFELARLIADRLAGHGDVVDEVHGFRYFDERDLLGFVDGSENPNGPAAVRAVFVEEDDPDFVGGSYVIVQKYVHDLDAWNLLTTEQQERAIGRSKADNVEMPDDLKPSNAHIALNVIEDEDGNERKIVRENLPFGSVGSGEFGTYFIGYAADPAVTELMLQRMFVGHPVGNHDRILDFSTAVTGSLYFVPTVDFLDDLGD